jgi:hypothetical protein
MQEGLLLLLRGTKAPDRDGVCFVGHTGLDLQARSVPKTDANGQHCPRMERTAHGQIRTRVDFVGVGAQPITIKPPERCVSRRFLTEPLRPR